MVFQGKPRPQSWLYMWIFICHFQKNCHLCMFLWVFWETVDRKMHSHRSCNGPVNIQYKKDRKVHKLTHLNSVINLHHLSHETEKCHVCWNTFILREFWNMHNLDFDIFWGVLFLNFLLPAEGAWKSVFLCVCWKQRPKPIRNWFEELNLGSLWPWQRLYLCDSWWMEMEERRCYMDCVGA